jgi:glycosyltransferase involved in cell wall biosynthesis
MLFDLLIGGHHAGYILHLIQHWCNQKLSGQMDIVVSPRFASYHSDVVNAALNADSNINFVAITPEEEAELRSLARFKDRVIRSFQEWNLLRKYVKLLQPTHCLIMYFDTCQWPLGVGRSLPCKFSSIYFRPTFHYEDFEGYTLSRKDKLQQLRETLFLTRILTNSQLETLFCLDPFAVEHLNRFRSPVQRVYLPDPVQVYRHSPDNIQKLKTQLGIEEKRQVFLLFGALEKRKGIFQLLDAIAMLSSDLCERLCLFFAGPLSKEDEAIVRPKITQIQQTLPVQIIVDNQFIPEQKVQPYFQLADVILAPYQRHVGMSAILVRAAAAEKPVLCQSYGLMGEVTRRYRLGLAINSSLAEEIMKGMTRFLVEPHENMADKDRMKLFAQQNHAQKFADTIFQYSYK